MSLLLLFGQSEIVSPTVTSQPSSTEVYEGQTATFTVAATGGGLSYQWQLSNNSGGSWSNISGATSSSYTTAATVRTTDNNDQFRCVVTNSAGTANSDAATLTVWSPAALTGLQLWLDASDASTIFEDTADLAEDNDSVRIWADKSGNALDASQATVASRPVYRAGEQNGRGVIEFDGADDFLTSGTVATFNNLHDGTGSLVCVVAKPGFTSNPNSEYGIIGNNGGSSINRGYLLAFDDLASASRNDCVYDFIARGVSSQLAVFNLSSNGGLTPNVFSIIDDCIDADNATAALRSKIRVNNGSEIALNVRTSTPSASNASFVLHIGNAGNSVIPLFGQIAEVIICNDQNASLLTKLRNYLSWKWGITIA